MPKGYVNTFDDDWLYSHAEAVTETGCLIWLGGLVKGGYGKTSDKGKTVMAHRAVWEARNGPIPDGKVLCHRCDVPTCVNPAHLFLGTHQDNSADMVKKCRQAKGEQVSLAKLNEALVKEIRAAEGRISDVARMFGLKKGVVRQIRRRETWRHV